MQKLWQKKWQLNKVVETFETQGDLVLDQKLVAQDVLGSLAHAKGLQKIGILSAEETQLLATGLQKVLELNQQNQFVIQPGDEDVHTKIENYLTETLGEVGKKIHTGRSRNDQILTDLRLFTKDNLLVVWSAALELTQTLLDFAQLHETVLMPGYTHMQKAMPSTVGMWAGALAEGLLDSLISLKSAYQINNQSPLGSAAGYGVPLELDRSYVASQLGFAKVQNNSLSCQNSKGKVEGLVLAALVALLQDLNKLATDVLLFSTAEFGFFEVAAELCSGSSIMPQKKNVDVAELLRSKVHVVLGNYTQIISLSSNLMSGYNRDSQDIKKPLMESFEITAQSLQVATLLVHGLSVNHVKIAAAMTPDLFATHIALELVEQGLPFREAYQQAAATYQGHQTLPSSEAAIAASQHLGGIGNLGLAELQSHLTAEQTELEQEQHSYHSIINSLISQKGNHEKKD